MCGNLLIAQWVWQLHVKIVAFVKLPKWQTFVSSPVLLLVAHWNWWMNSMLHGPLFIIHLDPLSCRSDITEPSGKKTRLDCKPTGYKAPSSGSYCVLQPQNNTEPHQPLRWIQVLYYFSPNVHRYSVFVFCFFFTIHIWQVEGKYLPYR